METHCEPKPLPSQPVHHKTQHVAQRPTPPSVHAAACCPLLCRGCWLRTPGRPQSNPPPPPLHARALAQDIAEALRRLPPEVVIARNQRLKRAMDLSMKHEKLPKALREKQTPFEHYLLVGTWGEGFEEGACGKA